MQKISHVLILAQYLLLVLIQLLLHDHIQVHAPTLFPQLIPRHSPVLTKLVLHASVLKVLSQLPTSKSRPHALEIPHKEPILGQT